MTLANADTAGPPYPDRILLTGLRHPLHMEHTVAITLTFARAGRRTADGLTQIDPLSRGSRQRR